MRRTSIVHAALVLFVSVFTLLCGKAALAQKQYSYSPHGPITIKTVGGETGYSSVAFSNLSNSPLTLYFTFSGDTTFKSFWRPVEFQLCANCTVDFAASFAAIDNDLDSAQMYITDGVHSPDTIRFYGQDTGVFPWRVDTLQHLAGSRFGLSDTAWVTLRNQLDKPIDVFGYLVPQWSSGFTALEPITQTIPAQGTATYYFRYQSESYDTAHATVQFYGERWLKNVDLSGARHQPSNDTLSWSGAPDFGPRKRGTTTCRIYTIYNRFDSPAQISSIAISMNPNVFELESAPDVPFTLVAQDSFEVSVCFKALFEEGTGMGGGVRVGYQYQGDVTRFVELYMMGRTAQCIEVEPTVLDFDTVALGASATRSLTLTNYSDNDVEVDSVVIWDFSPGFALASARSFTIPASESRSVDFSFTPVDVGGDTARYTYVGIFTKGTCDFLGTIYLGGIPVEAPLDSTLHQLFADSTQTLVFTGDSAIALETFRFINDLSDSIKVTSVSLKDATHFEINDIEPQMPELTLAPDSIMSITLEFVGTPGIYDDTLTIVTEDALLALTFPIHATRSGSLVEPGRSLAPVLLVSPNPASGPVQIAVKYGQLSGIEVIDQLGTVVAMLGGNMWDPRSTSSGTYYLRVRGVSDDGNPFVVTRRVIIR